VLVVGVCVAYYNTSSFGYDKTQLVAVNDESIELLDYKIEYEKIKKGYKKIVDNMPSTFVI
jgi:hypothetical protein